MNILITGYTGFVGRHLIKKLEQLGYHIYACNSKYANLLKPIPKNKYPLRSFSYIIHLAVLTKAGDFSLKNSGTEWISNQLINTNILNYWKTYQPQAKMVCFGTSCGYDPSFITKTEDRYLTGKVDEDLYVYAMTKRMLLIGLQALHKQFGLNYLYFIPSTIYGPLFDKEDSHFIFDLIKKISAKKDVVLWGTGEQKRELVYIDDVVDFVVNNLDKNNEEINIATGKEFSIKQYAEMICEYVGYDKNLIQYDRTKFQGVQSKVLQPSKYGACNQTKIEDGLKKTIDYYLDSRPTVGKVWVSE